jgi:hypothetical protein
LVRAATFLQRLFIGRGRQRACVHPVHERLCDPGPARRTTIPHDEPAVYDQFSRAGNWPFGAALAFILLVVTLLMTVIGSTALGRKYRTA